MENHHIIHLYNRAAFGILPDQLKEIKKYSRTRIVKNLFNESDSFRPLKIPTPEIDAHFADLMKTKKGKASSELIKKSRMKQKDLNKAWFKKMITANESLRERMVLFWANHFVCRDGNILFIQKFNNTLRQHALGNFKDFVIAIAKEPAMLNYLNNQQNRKNSPNENFARELMELFTLGQGNYSEEDIKEAARAFTGWRHNRVGEFKLVRKQHDEGEKTFFGSIGNFNGEDIINIIFEQPECSQFICTKLYRYFVNEQIDERRVNELALLFRKDYDIKKVLAHIFTSDWFYEDEHIGSKIKSPIDFLVGLTRVVPYSFNKLNQLIYVQKLLGQVLLMPPNVAGWPGGKNWIDTNTLMTRLMLPSVLLTNGSIAFDVKGEFEDKAERFEKNRNFNRKLSIAKDWDAFQKNFRDVSREELTAYLIGVNLSKATKQFLVSLEKESKENFSIQLMSLPEYQLC